MRLCLSVSLAIALAGCTGEDGLVTFNEPPVVTIVEPVDGAVFDEGEPIRFVGRLADDTGPETLEAQWSSSLEGVLPALDPPDTEGNVEFVTNTLVDGEHIITLRAFDADDDNGESSVTITINDVPDPPFITVEHPTTDDIGIEGVPFIFMATAGDEQDTPEALVIELTANPGGFVCWMVPDGAGRAQCTAEMALGDYLLTFKATDTDGNVASANAVFKVVDRNNFDGDGDGFTPNSGDCNDGADQIYPGASEVCDGLDNDCNELTAIDVGTPCYDDDADGYCEQPPCVNATNTLGDCDDADPSKYPQDIPETLNGMDDNCDGRVDEGTSVYDDDADGYCETPPCVNTANTQADCNDADYNYSPGLTEVCGDGIDNNCNGSLNEEDSVGCSIFYKDADADGYGIPGDTACYCDGGVAPYTGINTLDCYDNNANAFPGQAAYFPNHRGDGSFDYDCDNGETKQYYGVTSGCSWDFEPFECDINGAGWEGSERSCGQTGNYVGSCDSEYDAFCFFLCAAVDPSLCTDCWACEPDVNSTVQGCR